MFISYKYRIYPTEQQKILIGKHFGASRLVYNLALELKQSVYNQSKKNVSYFDLTLQLKELKEAYPFLKEINAQTLESSLKNLEDAYKRFFNRVSKYPKFKFKHSKQSFISRQANSVSDKNLFIPKFREGILIVLHRKYKGKIKSVTISKTPSNKYFASILCETPETIPVKKPINNAVGIDVGIKTFATLSDGTVIENPKHLKNSLAKLKVLQRRLSRKQKGSNRRNKFKLRVAREFEKVTNQRKDFLHKVSNVITKRYDTIVMEDLNISGMLKNHKLAQAISDVSWGEFNRQLAYKSEWRGNNLIKIGRFEPSSRLCSSCGAINKDLKLSDRSWTCVSCGSTHERDFNAAKNILQFGVGRTNTDAELSVVNEAVKRLKVNSI